MAAPEIPKPEPVAALIVMHPSGHRRRMELSPLPFLIGRQADNHLILRDTRASRHHARIVRDNGEYAIEDLNSSHGVFVNGFRVPRQVLHHSDRIEFGVPDSYQITFVLDETPVARLDEVGLPSKTVLPRAESLGKLRAIVEVARALETSLTLDDVLTTLVDAALTVTGAERGFLLLKKGAELEVRVARDMAGRPLPETDLKVPTSVIHRSLTERRDLLSMNFDPLGATGVRPEHTVATLDLRSVVCVPLVRIRAGTVAETSVLSSLRDTVGVLYLDSRSHRADLSSGNRELLTTLAIEASTVLENARLLEEERAKQRIEEELKIARSIQEGLLPKVLPATGWFRAAGKSIPSHAVGGDYFDVRAIAADCWAIVVADVSGKGVSSALLASFLQGVFLCVSRGADQVEEAMNRLNAYLLERAGGEKYATLFYAVIEKPGLMRYVNAGHASPILVHPTGELEELGATGLPLGLLEEASYEVHALPLRRGDRLIAVSDGVTEARSPKGHFYGETRLKNLLLAHPWGSCNEILRVIETDLRNHTEGTLQGDDITILTCEYASD